MSDLPLTIRGGVASGTVTIKTLADLVDDETLEVTLTGATTVPRYQPSLAYGIVTDPGASGSLAVGPPITTSSPAGCSRAAKFAQGGVPGLSASSWCRIRVPW